MANVNREAAYAQAAAEEKAFSKSEKNFKKGNDERRYNTKKYDKKPKYKIQIANIGEGILFDSKSKNLDMSSASSTLTGCSFDTLSIPVKMAATLVGKTGNFLVDVGYINKFELGMEGEYFDITIKDAFVEAYEKVGGTPALYIKTIVDKDGNAVRFTDFELRFEVKLNNN